MSFHRPTPPGWGVFEVQGEEVATPKQYTAVRETDDDRTKIRMLEQMVEALAEENARLGEEVLQLRSRLLKQK